MGSALSHYLAFLPWIPLMVDCTCKMNLALFSLSFLSFFLYLGVEVEVGRGVMVFIPATQVNQSRSFTLNIPRFT